MPCEDYRLTPFSPEYEIATDKAALREEIRTEYPGSTNMYTLVSGDYKERFSKVYLGRCAYCGVLVGVISMHEFQIDHVISEHAYDMGEDKFENGRHDLDNLAFACFSCNNRKRGFVLNTALYDLLSPDRSLGSTFKRDADYRIVISKQLEGNVDVKQFYEQLHLGSELRRIDHLIASIIDLRCHIEGSDLPPDPWVDFAAGLRRIQLELVEGRNVHSASLINSYPGR